MATYTGATLVPSAASSYASCLADLDAIAATITPRDVYVLGGGARRYKCQATNANAPNGVVTWVNEDASTTNRPVYAGAYGPTEIIDSWTVGP